MANEGVFGRILLTRRDKGPLTLAGLAGTNTDQVYETQGVIREYQELPCRCMASLVECAPLTAMEDNRSRLGYSGHRPKQS